MIPVKGLSLNIFFFGGGGGGGRGGVWKILNTELLVFCTVAGPRNLTRSVKSRDIDKKARNPTKFSKICT